MNECRIVSVGKRRDGGTKYWCLEHRADATAKYGKPANQCRYSHVAPLTDDDIVRIEISEFNGGIALWGAIPAVYDTTTWPMERGIHVHARKVANGEKQIDNTYKRVVLERGDGKELIEVNELDAIYYMVSSVFRQEMTVVICTRCGYSHLDKDWFSVHSHIRHLCSGCGYNFKDTKLGIGNPVIAVRDIFEQGKKRSLVPAARKLDIRQSDFPGGIQLYGSNPAIVWTSNKSEEEGIHVHAYMRLDKHEYAIDNTYDDVTIDGIRLNADQLRTLMAQNALPHINGRVQSLICPFCEQYHFDIGSHAYTPHDKHLCEWCGREFSAKGRLRQTIGNPMVSILEKLSKSAARQVQKHDMGLLPETI